MAGQIVIHRQIGLGFWFRWVLAGIFGWGVGGFLIAGIVAFMAVIWFFFGYNHDEELFLSLASLTTLFVALITNGIVWGAVQSSLIRQYVHWNGRWILANALGALGVFGGLVILVKMGILSFFSIDAFMSLLLDGGDSMPLLASLLLGGGIGAVFGFVQGYLALRQHLSPLSWAVWILANAVGGVLIMTVVVILISASIYFSYSLLVAMDSSSGGWVFGLIIGSACALVAVVIILHGGITGGAMAWVLRNAAARPS